MESDSQQLKIASKKLSTARENNPFLHDFMSVSKKVMEENDRLLKEVPKDKDPYDLFYQKWTGELESDNSQASSPTLMR